MKPLEFDAEQCRVMSMYHGGISSMLYAASSVGELKVGLLRRGVAAKDQMRELAERLEDELEDAIELADNNCAKDDSDILDDCLMLVVDWLASEG